MCSESKRMSFEVFGDRAMFTVPVSKTSGDRTTYEIPTYEAMKGIVKSVYWKPTFIPYVDRIRVMEEIRLAEPMFVHNLRYFRSKTKNSESRDQTACHTYLKACRYQVEFHFEWNPNCPDMGEDRKFSKHEAIYERSIRHGGRMNVFLGTSECVAYVRPCKFKSDAGFYDGTGVISYPRMYHGMCYPSECRVRGEEKFLVRTKWDPKMIDGVIEFPRPEDCLIRERVRVMPMTPESESVFGLAREISAEEA